MGLHQPPQTEKIDSTLTILANQHCRATLSYFQAADDVCSLDDVVAELTAHGSGEEDNVRLRLHHAVLPRLDDAGALDYDGRSHTIRYRGHYELETVLDAIESL